MVQFVHYHIIKPTLIVDIGTADPGPEFIQKSLNFTGQVCYFLKTLHLHGLLLLTVLLPVLYPRSGYCERLRSLLTPVNNKTDNSLNITVITTRYTLDGIP